ncbi:MAG: hypothetical protein DRN81_03780 [Thermoproteota archaeon]|nr:MAG: hypothetical protein DRN81_03780 [Candidatus Korarchaeota archaeon]
MEVISFIGMLIMDNHTVLLWGSVALVVLGLFLKFELFVKRYDVKVYIGHIETLKFPKRLTMKGIRKLDKRGFRVMYGVDNDK